MARTVETARTCKFLSLSVFHWTWTF
ncbi:unnamed protein product [Acanthoscelides obtectus]|uniref:Uncharacterized protein n=1 Tax=Acanthoscelides obtectus TaxID=200917 RepID=A0A9P0MIG5_ACAOB|nr:unnamed protein product [Acanthoscelides obtectus]CAK1655887.1 hypothetical protein AOBTE_LOCUS19414 [Acanthoscelides obtectus]